LADERSADRRGRRRRRFVVALALFAPLAVVAAVHARATAVASFEAAGRALAVFGGAFVAATAVGLFAGRRSPSPLAIAARLDAASGAGGLYSAATHALDPRRPTRLGPLVLMAADVAVAGLPPLPLRPAPRWCGPRMLVFLLIAILISFAPRGPYGALGGSKLGTKDAGVVGDRPAGASNENADDAGKIADARPELRDLAKLFLRAGTTVVAENEEIVLGLELIVDHATGDDPPLELVLAVADGLPSPDQGFGEGFHVARLGVAWRLPKEDGGRVMDLVPMLQSLKDLGIYRDGLFTFVAAARVADPKASIRGGVLSNQLTVRISPNVEKSRTEAPSRVPQESEASAAPAPQKPDGKPAAGRGSKPELGAPQELPDAETFRSLVRPLFNEGPTVEKEVAVYDREEGGDAPPPPSSPPPPAAPGARAFERRPEAALVKPSLAPAERDSVRRYFERLRRGRGP
jgi:hypothetical protein